MGLLIHLCLDTKRAAATTAYLFKTLHKKHQVQITTFRLRLSLYHHDP